jgi:hypothetical protein
MAINSPIKIRRLKNADREADFFFIDVKDTDGFWAERFYLERQKRANTFLIF